jgi:fatty-acid desaturase
VRKEESQGATVANASEIIELSASHHLKRVPYLVITNFIVLAGTVIAARELPASPLDLLYVLPIIILATALGVNTALHMHFTHDSFKFPKPFQHFLAVFGTFGCKESLSQWAANHKRNHKHVDIRDFPHMLYQFGDSKLAVFTIGLLWATIGRKFSRRIISKSYHKLAFLKGPDL